MKKRKLKKWVIYFFIVVPIIILSTILIININSDKTKLKKKGYTKDETILLLNNFNKEEIKNIIKKEYNQNLPKLITQKYYIPDNLDRYIEYANKENDMEKVISTVNVNADKEWYTDIKETDIDDGNKMIINKYYHLSDNYNPDDIVPISNWYAYEGNKIKKEVYDNYKLMWEAAKKENLTLLVNSGFRTLEEQKEQFEQSGDNFASRPGHSEHQSGLALDIVTYDIIGNDFENTKEFEWLSNNAFKYGFILRYPKGKENLTGYSYESWHYRYLGSDLATKVHESGLTYDEYYAYFCEYKKAC